MKRNSFRLNSPVLPAPTITQYIRQCLTTTERHALCELLVIPKTSSIAIISLAAQRRKLEPATIKWFLDERSALPEPEPMPSVLAKYVARMEDELTPRDINVLFVKFGFAVGYEPLRCRAEDIARKALARSMSIKALRTLCDTRAMP